jgi:Curli production assembly/transport component CsgG
MRSAAFRVVYGLLFGVVLSPLACCESTKPAAPTAATAAGTDFQKYEKCAVIVSDPDRRVSEGQQAEVESVFSKALLSRGYRVASRSDVAAALKEINFQQSGVTEAQAAQIGRMLSVPGIMVVRVTEYATTAHSYQGSTSYHHACGVDARFIDVATAEIIWQNDGREKSGMLFDSRDARGVLHDAAGKAIREFPGRVATKG